MNLLYNIAVIFALGATILAQPTAAAPAFKLGTVQDINDQTLVLSNALSGLIQNSQVPDPGIVDWFTEGFNSIASRISERLDLADRDPEKIEAVRNFIIARRTLLELVADFVEKYYPNETVAINLIKASRTFLSTLDKIVDGNYAGQQTHKGGVLNAVTKLIRSIAAAQA